MQGNILLFIILIILLISVVFYIVINFNDYSKNCGITGGRNKYKYYGGESIIHNVFIRVYIAMYDENPKFRDLCNKMIDGDKELKQEIDTIVVNRLYHKLKKILYNNRLIKMIDNNLIFFYNTIINNVNMTSENIDNNILCMRYIEDMWTKMVNAKVISMDDNTNYKDLLLYLRVQLVYDFLEKNSKYEIIDDNPIQFSKTKILPKYDTKEASNNIDKLLSSMPDNPLNEADAIDTAGVIDAAIDTTKGNISNIDDEWGISPEIGYKTLLKKLTPEQEKNKASLMDIYNKKNKYCGIIIQFINNYIKTILDNNESRENAVSQHLGSIRNDYSAHCVKIGQDIKNLDNLIKSDQDLNKLINKQRTHLDDYIFQFSQMDIKYPDMKEKFKDDYDNINKLALEIRELIDILDGNSTGKNISCHLLFNK